MYVYIYIYAYIYIYVYIYIYIRTCIHASILYNDVYTFIYTYTYIRICAYVNGCVYRFMRYLFTHEINTHTHPSSTHAHSTHAELYNDPASYRISLACSARVCVQQCCHHLRPSLVLCGKIQRETAILGKSRQSTTSACETGRQPRVCFCLYCFEICRFVYIYTNTYTYNTQTYALNK